MPTASCSKDSGIPARHDFHLSRRSFAGVELQNRSAPFFGEESGVFWPKKKSSATRPPPPKFHVRRLASEPAFRFRYAETFNAQRLQFRQTCRRSQLQESSAIRRRSQHALPDPRMYSAAPCGRRASAVHLGRNVGVTEGKRDGIEAVRRPSAGIRRPSPWRRARNQRPRCARMKNALGERCRCRHTRCARRNTRSAAAESADQAIHPPSARFEVRYQNRGRLVAAAETAAAR